MWFLRKKKEFVLWVENDQRKRIQILQIFDQFPPLTSRLTMQLEFFRKCFFEKNVAVYLSTRDLKYKDRQEVMLQMEKKHVHTLAYFPQWISGFIEREGCFYVGKNNNSSFSIGQKHDVYLIQAIQKFLGSTNKIQQKKK